MVEVRTKQCDVCHLVRGSLEHVERVEIRFEDKTRVVMDLCDKDIEVLRDLVANLPAVVKRTRRRQTMEDSFLPDPPAPHDGA